VPGASKLSLSPPPPPAAPARKRRSTKHKKCAQPSQQHILPERLDKKTLLRQVNQNNEKQQLMHALLINYQNQKYIKTLLNNIKLKNSKNEHNMEIRKKRF